MAAKKKTEKKIAKPIKSKKAKSSVKDKKNKEKDIPQKVSFSDSFKDLKLGESYVSLVLGAIVVFIIFMLFFVYIRGSKNETSTTGASLTPTSAPTIVQSQTKEYVVLENESLWDIAVREFGDGFRYVEIVEANPGVITNPDYVPPGTKIKIPILPQ